MFSERNYLFTVGVVTIASIYLEQLWIIPIWGFLFLIEGLFGVYVPEIVSRDSAAFNERDYLYGGNHSNGGRWDFEARRLWRLMAAMTLPVLVILEMDMVVLYAGMFFGFALIGSGLSGVCPLYVLLKKSGFK